MTCARCLLDCISIISDIKSASYTRPQRQPTISEVLFETVSRQPPAPQGKRNKLCKVLCNNGIKFPYWPFEIRALDFRARGHQLTQWQLYFISCCTARVSNIPAPPKLEVSVLPPPGHQQFVLIIPHPSICSKYQTQLGRTTSV